MAVGRTNSIGLNTADATATADDILYGKTAYGNNTVITGTIVTNTSADLTASDNTVTVPAGYYATPATKSIATTTHPNPTASINSSTGVVTASHTQTAGYVSAGTTTGTLQLSTQAAATITPGTSNKTAVAAGKYTTGAVTVAGDADLTAANIKNGVNIFGVAGTFTYATAASAAGAGHILKDKVAFVNGSQVTGTIVTKTASDVTVSGGTVTTPAGYYASQVAKSVGTGTAKPPTSVSGTSATVSTGTNTLTLSKTISITPVVTAGYVSSGTAANATVSLTGSVTTKAAATITPSTSNQTIAAGTYLTGAQTIAGNANLIAANIKKGVTIFGVMGTYEGGESGLQSKILLPIKNTISSTSAASSVTFNSPLSFSNYSVICIDIVGNFASKNTTATNTTFRIVGKNSSNTTVNNDVSISLVGSSGSSVKPYCVHMMITSSGIISASEAGYSGASVTGGGTAVAQITGVTINASLYYTGATATIYGAT